MKKILALCLLVCSISFAGKLGQSNKKLLESNMKVVPFATTKERLQMLIGMLENQLRLFDDNIDVLSKSGNYQKDQEDEEVRDEIIAAIAQLKSKL